MCTHKQGMAGLLDRLLPMIPRIIRMRFRSLVAAALAISAAAGPTSAADPVQSRYTTLDVTKCRQLVKPTERGGRWRCPGVLGYGVEIDDHLNTDLAFLRRGRTLRLGALSSSFYTLSKALEWRVRADNGNPAVDTAIFRVTITGRGLTPGPRRQFLYVAKVRADRACIIGTVDARVPGRSANLLARRMADGHASAFVCGRDPWLRW